MASVVNVHAFLSEKSDTCVYKKKENKKKREGLNFPAAERRSARMNYVRLYELIFNRVFDPVESQALLRLLEIPPADPGTFLAGHVVGETKVVARFAGGHLNQILFLKASIVLKADFIAIRTNAAFLS